MGQLPGVELSLTNLAFLEQHPAHGLEARMQSEQKLSCLRGQNIRLRVCVRPRNSNYFSL
jgi:hypothetical protein